MKASEAVQPDSLLLAGDGMAKAVPAELTERPPQAVVNGTSHTARNRGVPLSSLTKAPTDAYGVLCKTVRMDLGLRDRVYVMTGASRGLGFATAQVLVQEGARVVLTGRDGAAVQAAAADLGGAALARGIEADNADPESARRVVNAAHEAFGRVDGALISGPSPRGGSLCDVTDEDWRSGFESVFLGALRIARAVADSAGVGGSIVLVLAVTARVPSSRFAISSGLRPGLAMAAKILADELGPSGIRVNSLLPGRMATDGLREIDTSVQGSATRVRDQASLDRDGMPGEFARVAAFVLSPAASYMTGSNILVDGGFLRAP